MYYYYTSLKIPYAKALYLLTTRWYYFTQVDNMYRHPHCHVLFI